MRNYARANRKMRKHWWKFREEMGCNTLSGVKKKKKVMCSGRAEA